MIEIQQPGASATEEEVSFKANVHHRKQSLEKRKVPRLPLGGTIFWRVLGSPMEWQRGVPKDISRRGVRLILKGTIRKSARIELKIQIPHWPERIYSEGCLVWTRTVPAGDALVSVDEDLAECGVAFDHAWRGRDYDKFMCFLADKLSDLDVREATRDICCHPADDLEDLKGAYRIIYKEYRERNYCLPHDSGMHCSFYCVLPGSRTFVLKRDDRLLGTASLIVDSPCGIPMETSFPHYLQPLRASGARLAEVSLFAFDREAIERKRFSLNDFQKVTAALTFKLFKLLFDYARFVARVTDLVIAVHPKHENLYRYLTFETIGPPESYGAACGHPAVPMCLNIEKSVPLLFSSEEILRYFVEHITKSDLLSRRFEWGGEALKQFFSEKNDLWQNLPDSHRSYIQTCYPDLEM